MQIKTQLDIKLNQADISEAVAQFLASHGYTVQPEDLENIKYVNTRNDGMTASITVSNESDTAEPETNMGEADQPTTDTVEPVPETVAVEPETVEVYPETVEPGAISTSTVEDVMPSVDEIKQMQDTATEEPRSRPVFGHYANHNNS